MATAFHIGYHKTASTWLQLHVFPHLLGRVSTYLDPTAEAILKNVANADDNDFVPRTAQAFIAEREERHRTPLLLTYEGLSGQLWHRGENGPRSVHRLARIEPGARILVFAREQRSMLRSIYFQYVYEGGRLSSESFFADLSGENWEFSFDHVCFDRLVGLAVEQFGAEHVCVLPYELLTVDPDSLLNTLTTFLEATLAPVPAGALTQREHHSVGAESLALIARYNSWFRSSPLHRHPTVIDLRMGRRPADFVRGRIDPAWSRLRPRPPKPPPVRVDWLKQFATSNERLQAFCRHNLGQLGYLVPS